MAVKLDRENLRGFVENKDVDAILPRVKKAHESLENRTGQGSEFTGWMDLPTRVEDKFIAELVDLGEQARKNSDCLLSIGIGGSYLGIRSTVEFLRKQSQMPVYYAGHNMSADYLHHLLTELKDRRITVAVISKSGTTTEPALAFRIVDKFLKEHYSTEEIRRRVICITDAKKGALLQIAKQNNFKSYVIPDDVGGRFSILTPVGLVPLAIAGIDIKALIAGAREAQAEYSKMDLDKNAAYQYAVARILLYQKHHKVIEVFGSFYDNTKYLIQWWKQLFGESEGKDGKSIFPSSLMLSTDLHSMGQLLQDGMRNVFETFLEVEKTEHAVLIPEDPQNLDDFNCVAGKDLDWVNKQAYKATASAHFEGGVPNMMISIDRADAFHLGKLYYFFEKAVAISGYLLEVNTFNQPGVEAYKKKMFALLGKK